MGYEMANGRYARTRSVTLLATGTVVTATGAQAAVELGDQAQVRLDLNVTAVSGASPSLTVTVETSADGSTNWTSVGAFAAQTAVGSQHKVFTGLDRFVRANVTAFAGTSVTGGVTGESI